MGGTQILLGLGERELQPIAVDFVEQPHLIVLGETGCGKTTALRTLCREIMRTNDADSAQLVMVDFRRTLLGVVTSEHLAGYAISAAALTSQLPALLDRLQARMPGDDVTQHQLRTRSWWSGPEIYVVVDDYDLVATATGNPLTPLLDFLPHAKDLGLHVVVARRSGGAARAMFDPILARLRDMGAVGPDDERQPRRGHCPGLGPPVAVTARARHADYPCASGPAHPGGVDRSAVTDVVVEVGPGTVRGPGDVPAELVSAALECIDDELALIDDHPVGRSRRVAGGDAVGGRSIGETVVLVCPTWWASRRINVVRDAAADAATDVVVLQRAHVLADELPARTCDGGRDCARVALSFRVTGVRRWSYLVWAIQTVVAEAVAGEVGATAAVLVDAAVGVNGAGPLAVAIADRVRARGVSVSIADQDWVLRAVPATRSRQPDDACVVESRPAAPARRTWRCWPASCCRWRHCVQDLPVRHDRPVCRRRKTCP